MDSGPCFPPSPPPAHQKQSLNRGRCLEIRDACGIPGAAIEVGVKPQRESLVEGGLGFTFAVLRLPVITIFRISGSESLGEKPQLENSFRFFGLLDMTSLT